MLRWMKTTLLAMALSVLLVPPGGAQTLDDAKPAAVPLDFLGWVGQSDDWLRSELAAQGLTSGYQMVDGRLESEDVRVLRAVNRIRTFAHLSTHALRPPYFDLTLKGPDGSLSRCVTVFPRSIVPAISAGDFKTANFSAADAEPTILEMCRVEGARLAEFAGMERRVLRERFFESNGDLKTEFVQLNNNPALVAAMIDQGYFVYQGDVTGRVRVEP